MDNEKFMKLANRELESVSTVDYRIDAETFETVATNAFINNNLLALKQLMCICESEGMRLSKLSCKELAVSKLLERGENYAKGEDRLSNFKASAKFMSKDPLDNLQGYVRKHLEWVYTFTANDEILATKEQIIEHVGDVFNYCILAIALMEETE